MKQGWQIKTIEECFRIRSGDFLPADRMNRNGDIGVYGGNGFIDNHDEFNLDGENIIIGRVGAKCGNTRLVKGKIWVTDNAFYISKFFVEFDLRFLEYSLSLKDLRKSANQAAQPVISYTTIKGIQIVIPPLPEQHRIVAILDEVFESITRAKDIAERNLRNAREVFESYLQGVFANPGEGWIKKSFDKVCVLQRGFDLPTHSRNAGSYPLVSSNGISDRINLWKIKSPGVVTGRSGTIGNVHYIEEDYWPLNTALYVKNFNGNYEKCVYYFLKQFNLEQYSSGAGVPTLNRNNVHSEQVCFPTSLSEQFDIVKTLDILTSEVNKLESIFQQKLIALEELRKSVLQKAFSGEL